jgi:hypothetical protein
MAWLDGRRPTNGTYLLRGDQVGRVIAAGVLEVIVAMPPAYATRPRTDGGAAEGAAMRLLVPDGTAREVTVAAQQIADVGQPVPPALLSSQGGPVPESPNAPGTALRPVWVLRAGADADLVPWAGATVTGRLDLAPASLATQLAVQVQRLFLRVTRL